jgi:PAS domain S-box-containing protein
MTVPPLEIACAARVLAAALDAVITIDQDGRVVDLNPAAEALFGYARPAILGETLAELIIPPPLRQAHREAVRGLAEGGPPRILGQRVAMTAMRADGSEFPIELTVTRTAEDPPRFTAWIRDLAERRAAESRAERREQMLNHAEELARIGSWEWVPSREELLWSDNLFRLFGLEPGETKPTIDRPLLERTHRDDRPRLERAVRATLKGDRHGTLDFRVVWPDGSVRHLRKTANLERIEADGTRHVIGTVHDVTDRVHAEREIAAHVAVSEALSMPGPVRSTMEQLLRALAEALAFAGGRLWVVHDGELVESATWGVPGERTGLAALARAQRAPICRATGVAIPALTADDVLAVVELCSSAPVEMGDRLRRSFTGVGYELGGYLARRRGELGGTKLTAREIEILGLAACGCSAPEIAGRLVLSPTTVKTHFSNIYAKLGVSDRAAAVAYALRVGLIE